MKYKIVTSGKTKVFSIGEISHNLGVQSDIFIISDKEIYLGMISHKTLVLFATEFAHYALQNYAKKNNPEAEICISLVRKWIKDDTSVSNEELRVAAYAAYDAADAAADAAANAAYDAAVNAAYAAYAAASAAFNTSNAASAAYYAASAAADAAASNAAANAAAYAAVAVADAGVGRDKEYIRQGKFIIDFLKSGKNLFLV